VRARSKRSATEKAIQSARRDETLELSFWNDRFPLLSLATRVIQASGIASLPACARVPSANTRKYYITTLALPKIELVFR
jgi:hypothetical protein